MKKVKALGKVSRLYNRIESHQEGDLSRSLTGSSLIVSIFNFLLSVYRVTLLLSFICFVPSDQ